MIGLDEFLRLKEEEEVKVSLDVFVRMEEESEEESKRKRIEREKEEFWRWRKERDLRFREWWDSVVLRSLDRKFVESGKRVVEVYRNDKLVRRWKEKGGKVFLMSVFGDRRDLDGFLKGVGCGRLWVLLCVMDRRRVYIRDVESKLWSVIDRERFRKVRDRLIEV